MEVRMLFVLFLLLASASSQWITPEADPPAPDSQLAPGSFQETDESSELQVEPELPDAPTQNKPKEEHFTLEIEEPMPAKGPTDLEDPFAITLEQRRKRKEEMVGAQQKHFPGEPQSYDPYLKDKRSRHHGRRDHSKYANGQSRHRAPRGGYSEQTSGCMEWVQENPEVFYFVGLGVVGLLVVCCLKSGKKTGRRSRAMRQQVPQLTQLSPYCYPQMQPATSYGDPLQSQIRFHRMQIERLSSRQGPVRGEPVY